MKKVLLVIAMGAFLFSCGDGSDEEKDKDIDKGQDLCDCVNATDEQKKDEDFMKTCEKMGDEWEAEYEKASREEQIIMEEEIQDCEDASSELPYGAVGVGSPGELTVCDCIDIQIALMTDMLKGMSEEDAGTKYTNEMESCKALGDGKSQEELDAINKKAQDCPSMGEMQKIQQELMTKMMSEQMQEQSSDAFEEGIDKADDSEQ